ncbi:unnamed protein product, partial [Meganyctiphanes norvegica]
MILSKKRNLTLVITLLINIMQGCCALASKREMLTSGAVDAGTWGEEKYCSEGYYANAFQIKVQDFQGFGIEDTGLNRIMMYCYSHSLQETYIISVGVNEDIGTWKDKMQCNEGFLNGFQLRSHRLDSSIQDNMGATDLTMSCDNGSDSVLEGGGQGYGNHRARVHCPKGWAVTGVQARTDESPQDKKGITDIRMWCEPVIQEEDDRVQTEPPENCTDCETFIVVTSQIGTSTVEPQIEALFSNIESQFPTKKPDSDDSSGSPSSTMIIVALSLVLDIVGLYMVINLYIKSS